MIRLGFVLTGFLLASPAFAQLNEDFGDGDFTNNPSWVCNAADWTISNHQLQSNSSTLNSSFYISTPNALNLGAEWSFDLRLQFNTSSANYVDVYLMSTTPGLSDGGSHGYFLRIGNTQDEISLYRKDGTANVKITDGTDGVTNNSDNFIKIKVSRDAAGKFIVWSAVNAGAYSLQGMVTDNTYSAAGYFGFVIRQSTASFHQKHFIDNIIIKDFIPDLQPPDVLEVNAIASNKLEILFSESLDPLPLQQINNFEILPGSIHPVQVNISTGNPAHIILEFSNVFQPAINYSIQLKNLSDVHGNIMQPTGINFIYFQAERFDIVIHEFLADPSPPVDLPQSEYIEIKNRSAKPLQLNGWKFICNNNTSSSFPAITISPDSILIFTSTANTSILQSFGKTIGLTSFPSLPNDQFVLSLIDADGKTIHAVDFNISWYSNEYKKSGGWSMEMVDAQLPCSGINNWKESEDPSGGTPGKENSVKGNIADDDPPQLIRSYTIDSMNLVVVFNESLDSTSAADAASYFISSGLQVLNAIPLQPVFKEVQLTLQQHMQNGSVYEVSVSNISDCNQNLIGMQNKTGVGIPQVPNVADLVINEILFNPFPSGYDFVEIYNKSNRIIDLGKVSLANRNNMGLVSSITTIHEKPFYIFPGEYVVLTENAESLSKSYHVKYPGRVVELSLPSFPDEKGSVVLINHLGEILDELNYTDDDHYALLKNKEGVSLERMDPFLESSSKQNWHSAAASAGYATPGYINSQFRKVQEASAEVEIEPKVFSPDQDGMDDFMLLKYNTASPGYMMNAIIYNASGMPVKSLVKNVLMGQSGYFRWDGLNDKNEKLPVGQYIIHTRIFNLNGESKTFKHVVVLARRY